jgi:hypothetical protein
MTWFVFEARGASSATAELEQFLLLEAALKYGIDELMLITREDKEVSLAIGQVRGPQVDWLGEFRLDKEQRPTWISTTSESERAVRH